MGRLLGKTVFITGATAGIGRSCAKLFAAESCRLVLCARRSLTELKNEILQEHPSANIHVCQIDVSHRTDVFKEIKNIPLSFSKIDVLINNAGLAKGMEPLLSVSEEDFDSMMNTNVKGILNVTQAVLPGMLERDAGHIINIGSVAGKQSYPNGSVYCASKHAVYAMTQSLTMELVNTPLRVSHIAPGMVNTDFSTTRFEGDKIKADECYKGLKPLNAEDIAEIIVFTASRPAHVQINDVLVFPTSQASAYHVHRQPN